MKRAAVLMALTVVVAWGAASYAEKKAERHYINLRDPATSGLPFSDGVLVGDTLYLAGRLGLEPDTGKPPADPKVEAKLALDGIQRTLAKAGMTMDDLVYVQVFCSDVALYDDFNQVYRSYFKKDFPARAFIGSGPLLRGGRFEVQGIAVKR
ncbi:MAG TPA: Rid family hydrolase [Candidatus Xenobia bacterium]|nr:Rid family hydrolase [Candidatus Xenobia bacterium]